MIATALRVAPRDPDALIVAGDVQLALGRPGEARAHYESAAIVAPADPEAGARLEGVDAAAR